jgi:hypothetical protein
MTKKKSSAAEDIEINLGDEIPFEDETAYKAQSEEPDVVNDLRSLGQQFAETLRTAWNSEERKEFEAEMREGVQTFAGEIDKAFQEVKTSDPAQKVKSEAGEFKAKADAGDVVQKTRSSLSQGFRWFSEEMARVADSFTPVEKEPPAGDETDAEEE